MPSPWAKRTFAPSGLSHFYLNAWIAAERKLGLLVTVCWGCQAIWSQEHKGRIPILCGSVKCLRERQYWHIYGRRRVPDQCLAKGVGEGLPEGDASAAQGPAGGVADRGTVRSDQGRSQETAKEVSADQERQARSPSGV